MEISPMAEVPSRPCGGDFPGFNMFQWEKWWENMGENREKGGKNGEHIGKMVKHME